MLDKVKEFLLPFWSIAESLRALVELYEQELATRPQDQGGPVYRLTEKPSGKDTEVTYAGEEARKTLKERMADLLPAGDEGEDE